MSTDNEAQPGGELAEVHYLPATTEQPDDAIDGEIVTEEEYARLTSQKAKMLRRYQGYGADLVAAPRVVKAAWKHDRTKTVVTHVFGYPIGGAGVVVKHWRDTHGANRYERQMRLAEAGGDYERLLEWEARDVAEKDRRHKRMMDWLKAPKELVKAAGYGLAALAVLLLVIGVFMAIDSGQLRDIIAPVKAIISAIAFAVWFLTAYGVFLLVTGTVFGLAYLYQKGKRHAEMPQWLLKPVDTNGEGRDLVPDEGAILNALRNIGLAPLNKAFKEGWKPRWVSGTGRLGNGWHTQVLLPQGATVEMVAAKKGVLAHNLMRKPIEVWPTEPKDQPGVLDLWVADQGILSGPVDPWPLLHEGSADYFKGVQVALDARGEPVIGRLMAANYLIAGIMGSGKSSLVICLLLGAMLDPLVDIDVHVLAFNVDYDAMRPRLRSLVKGDEIEHIEAAMDTLRGLVGEVSRRGKTLEDLGGEDTKLTREIALKDPSMRPRVVVFDEVHELFTHKEYGEEAKESALKVTKKARKTGITLLWITPDADAASLPRGISKTASNRVAYAINDHQGNDAILGTGMHRRGYSATTLVAGEDVGTAMAAGFAKTPGLIRSHFVRKEKGIDEITPIVERALGLREDAGITSSATPVRIEVARDLLEDVAEVLGDETVKAADVPALLRELAPNWAPYRNLSGSSLRTQLDKKYGVRVPSTNNRYPIDPVAIREALARQATADLDDED